MWNKFNKKVKWEISHKGFCNIKNGPYKYPITRQLIKDGEKNKVLHKKIKSKINITMIHGQKDEIVPVIFSKKVLNIFSNAKKKIEIIKNGDHSLSNKKPLKKIIKELDKIVANII
jgi:alpha-beta hydrolase superfamily lysophospholipase